MQFITRRIQISPRRHLISCTIQDQTTLTGTNRIVLQFEKGKKRKIALQQCFSWDLSRCRVILHNAFWLQFQKTAAATATANPNKRYNKEVLFVWELRYVHALIDRQESPPLSKVVCHYPCVYRHLIPSSALHSSTLPLPQARHITIFVMFTSLMSGYKHLKTSLSWQFRVYRLET